MQGVKRQRGAEYANCAASEESHAFRDFATEIR
jgi:hypothetical protein